MWFECLAVQLWWGEETNILVSEAIKLTTICRPFKAIFLSYASSFCQLATLLVIKHGNEQSPNLFLTYILGFWISGRIAKGQHVAMHQCTDPPFSIAKCPETTAMKQNHLNRGFTESANVMLGRQFQLGFWGLPFFK